MGIDGRRQLCDRRIEYCGDLCLSNVEGPFCFCVHGRERKPRLRSFLRLLHHAIADVQRTSRAPSRWRRRPLAKIRAERTDEFCDASAKAPGATADSAPPITAFSIIPSPSLFVTGCRSSSLHSETLSPQFQKRWSQDHSHKLESREQLSSSANRTLSENLEQRQGLLGRELPATKHQCNIHWTRCDAQGLPC